MSGARAAGKADFGAFEDYGSSSVVAVGWPVDRFSDWTESTLPAVRWDLLP